jgi:hypothetical protein
MKAELNCCLDGVVFVMPPKSVVSRENFCRGQETHIWRKPGEGASPELAGHDNYPKQAPPDRCIPLWGGAGPGGFAPVLWHATRKITSEQWAEVVRDGTLVEAIRSVNPGKTRGPWGMLCDNETFLRARPSRVAHERKNITLWKIPAKSPDLNPVEKFWAWTRVSLRNMDLKDLVAKRPAAGRMLYKQRLVRLLKSSKAKQVAGNCVRGLRKVAREVIRKKGAASRG